MWKVKTLLELTRLRYPITANTVCLAKVRRTLRRSASRQRGGDIRVTEDLLVLVAVEGRAVAGFDKSPNGRDPSATCREGLNTGHHRSSCPLWSWHRTQPRSAVSRRIFSSPTHKSRSDLRKADAQNATKQTFRCHQPGVL